MPAEGCHSTLSHLWAQVTLIPGLSHTSWDTINSFWCDTVCLCFAVRFLAPGADYMQPASLCLPKVLPVPTHGTQCLYSLGSVCIRLHWKVFHHGSGNQHCSKSPLLHTFRVTGVPVDPCWTLQRCSQSQRMALSASTAWEVSCSKLACPRYMTLPAISRLRCTNYLVIT